MRRCSTSIASAIAPLRVPITRAQPATNAAPTLALLRATLGRTWLRSVGIVGLMENGDEQGRAIRRQVSDQLGIVRNEGWRSPGRAGTASRFGVRGVTHTFSSEGAYAGK